MESGELLKIQVRKVVQDVLMFVLHNQGLLAIRTLELSFVPDITAEFVDNLCIVVTFQMFHNECIWEGFLRNHFKRITKTPYLFANYFAYASYILSKEAKNAYSCFVDILSLVIHFALFCYQEMQDNTEFIHSCVDLFCAFFDKELCKKFEYQEMWKNFDKCLKEEYYETILKRRDEVIRNKESLNDALAEFRSSQKESEKPNIANDVLKNITTEQVEKDKKAISFAEFVGDKMKEVCGKTMEEVLNDFVKIEKQVEKLYRETAGVTSGERTSAEDQSSSQEIQEEFENVHSEANSTKNKDQSKEIEARKALEEVIKDVRKWDNPQETLNKETVGVASADTEDQPSSLEVQEALENISNQNKLNNNNNAAKRESKASDPLETRDSSPAPQESVQRLEITEKDIEETKIILQEMLKDIQKISELFNFLCEKQAI